MHNDTIPLRAALARMMLSVSDLVIVRGMRVLHACILWVKESGQVRHVSVLVVI
jgi:hypothetical protein